MRSHREAAEGTRDVKEAICIGGCPAKHPHQNIQRCRFAPTRGPPPTNQEPAQILHSHKANGSHDSSSSPGVMEKKKAWSSF